LKILKYPKFISDLLIKRGFYRLVSQIDKTKSDDWSAFRTVDFLFSQTAELIRPWQFKEEMMELANEVEVIQPKVVVEIGTANGGTLFMACRLAAKDALIISIDLPGGAFGGGYPEWKTPVYSSFAGKQQCIHLLRGSSHSTEIFNQLKTLLAGRKIDYLFIDGDHSYEGVKQDFEMYSVLTAKNAKVAFHDIVQHRDDSCNVHRFWSEIKLRYPYKEFVNDWNQKSFGVGVLNL
jgi:cephalosporin hydroxylase